MESLRKLTYLIINSIKIDLLTMMLLVVCLPPTRIEVLKFVNCNLDKKEADVLFNFLKSVKSKMKKLFIDWMPEVKQYLCSIGEAKTLEFLIVRGCQIDDTIFQQLLTSLKSAGTRLRLLDVYSNKITDHSIQFLGGWINDYKWVESFGFGLN